MSILPSRLKSPTLAPSPQNSSVSWMVLNECTECSAAPVANAQSTRPINGHASLVIRHSVPTPRLPVKPKQGHRFPSFPFVGGPLNKLPVPSFGNQGTGLLSETQTRSAPGSRTDTKGHV